ncbi:ATPase H(+)-transporting accessory protein 2 isoform X2 [Vanessa tameamea]|uniref:ATPase H(+)-transporting accessory protein 2 isoform X2 n=1 Tax=Vanessa tameamea TaxID=334116 RepID=A0A8B8HPS0_VANTA|nr:renin receptor [Vanessa tameamea]XP_047531598.1 ATPase H(+)-transporting accessory protein 2 [Vanessa atalanta]
MTVSHKFSNKMGVTMALFWITLVISIIGSNAGGEFSVLHSPQSLKFTGSSKTFESLLKEVFSASLGLSVEENSEWNGLSIVDPFNTPEAVVEVYIDGVSSLGENAGLKGKNFPLIVDEYEPDTYDAIEHRINQRFTNGGNKLVKIKLSEPDDLLSASKIFGEIVPQKVSKQSLQHLKYDRNEEDYQFLYELEVLKALTAKIRSGAVSADNILDFYNIRFRSLHPLSDLHGPNSLQTKEAKKLLGNALQELSDAFVKAYEGSVLVTAVTTDVAHTRSIRAAPEFRLEIQDNYTADYAAIFNIMLWFGVVFTFTLVAIVYAIMDMDPGRDSIIYRMTSTRMKKDN